MSLKVYDVTRDEVIKSSYALAKCDYTFAVQSLVPLIGRFEEQRKKQHPKFYARLRADILKGCVMPPITLAFVSDQAPQLNSVAALETFVNAHIADGYVLDGMQRLNTLSSASEDMLFPAARDLHVNVIVTERYDLLLYRMITLNNGQKPMTPRHQIEILTESLLDSITFQNIVVQTEKDTEEAIVQGAFKLFDISSAYTAFLTNNVNNQNNKIIDDKMNEILVGRVMDSGLVDSKIKFSSILELADKFSANKVAKTWLKIQNNLIGFTVGAKQSYDDLAGLSENEFAEQVEKFDKAFAIINPSKVNVGRYRRELSERFFREFEKTKTASADEVAEEFVEVTMID